VTHGRDDFARWHRLTQRQRRQLYWQWRRTEWLNEALLHLVFGTPVPDELLRCLELSSETELRRAYVQPGGWIEMHKTRAAPPRRR
jgi:hypothetical protein